MNPICVLQDIHSTLHPMAIKPENSFISKVNDQLPIKQRRGSSRARQLYPDWIHYEKMNNPYRSGTADAWYSAASDLWVEFKYLPVRPLHTTVEPLKLLTELQTHWLNDRWTEGRNVCVVIGCPGGGVVLDDCRWNHDIPASLFHSLFLSVVDLAAWIRSQVTSSR